ncbi:MAG: sigma-54-dependent Fis family transcriptional regulator [Magnetococcales bacterium]|nr:sigma-54-dependent Fis family transcriptional regulator [Magnetococcales bacterium]
MPPRVARSARVAVPPGAFPVVLVDDDPSVLFSAATVLRGAGLEWVETLADSRELLPFLARLTTGGADGGAAPGGVPSSAMAVVVLDLTMPYLSGLQLLPEMARHFPDVPVLVMTATDDVRTAVACMQAGATDFLVKPVEENRLVTSVRQVVEVCTLRSQVGALKRSLLSDHLEQEEAFGAILTHSRKMRALFQYMESIARSEEPVLITGETGVGKELIAATLHRLSRRAGPLVAVNVAGLDDTMVSDTLFGHRKGAYSGAEAARRGLVSEAGFGTLFLDEMGDLGATVQVKLLRLLQERNYYPLGSDVSVPSHARVVCATNQNVQQRMMEGRFRTDLYYRLRVHHIEVPPLRERLEDVALLTNAFLKEAAQALGKKVPTPPPALFTLLESYSFPGNVRQLRALVYDAVARHRSGVLSLDSFRHLATPPERVVESEDRRGVGEAVDDLLRCLPGQLPTLREAEQALTREAMRRAGGNQGIAAAFLGISRQALNQRLHKMRPVTPIAQIR